MRDYNKILDFFESLEISREEGVKTLEILTKEELIKGAQNVDRINLNDEQEKRFFMVAKALEGPKGIATYLVNYDPNHSIRERLIYSTNHPLSNVNTGEFILTKLDEEEEDN